MSGGSLNYVSGYIDEAVDEIERRINGEEVDECDVESLIREYDWDDAEAKYVREHPSHNTESFLLFARDPSANENGTSSSEGSIHLCPSVGMAVQWGRWRREFP